MYAEVVLKLRSEIKEGGKVKEVWTTRCLNLDVSLTPEKVQAALQTLVSQNITSMIEDAFDSHPDDIDEATITLKDETKKTKDDKKNDGKKSEKTK